MRTIRRYEQFQHCLRCPPGQLPNQDRLHTIALHELESRYSALCKTLMSNEKENADLGEIYWMLEELRVSLFAQQLGTAYPISEKRVKLKLAELKG